MTPSLETLDAGLRRALTVAAKQLDRWFWCSYQSEYVQALIARYELRILSELSAEKVKGAVEVIAGTPGGDQTGSTLLDVANALPVSATHYELVLARAIAEAAGRFWVAGWRVRSCNRGRFSAADIEAGLKYSFSECPAWRWLDSWSEPGVEAGGLFWCEVWDLAQTSDAYLWSETLGTAASVFFTAGWDARDIWQSQSN